jgi:hypothetical protein
VAKKGSYEIIYMLEGGQPVHRHRDNAPPPQSLYFYKPVRSVFFTRWFPMTKKWRVYDLRLFKVIQAGKHQKVIVPAPTVLFDDRDAAIMWMGLNV